MVKLVWVCTIEELEGAQQHVSQKLAYGIYHQPGFLEHALQFSCVNSSQIALSGSHSRRFQSVKNLNSVCKSQRQKDHITGGFLAFLPLYVKAALKLSHKWALQIEHLISS